MRQNKVPAKIEGDRVTFNFGTPTDFVLDVDRAMFGVMEGKPFCTVGWETLECELQWMRGKELFYRMIAERVAEYVRRREAENAQR